MLVLVGAGVKMSDRIIRRNDGLITGRFSDEEKQRIITIDGRAIRLLTATSKYCVLLRREKKSNVILPCGHLVCSDEIRHAKQISEKGAFDGSQKLTARNTKLHKSMFFWTVAQTVHFYSCLCGSGRTLLPPKTVPRNRNRIVRCAFGSCPFAALGFVKIQRNDG